MPYTSARAMTSRSVAFRTQGRLERLDSMLQDVDPEAPPVGLLLQQPGALPQLMLDRNHQRRAQLRLVLFEPGKGLLEQIRDPGAPVLGDGAPAAHRAQAVVHHRRDQLAAAGEVAIGGGAGNVGAHGDLGHGGHMPRSRDVHRLLDEQAIGPGPRAGLGGRRKVGGRGRSPHSDGLFLTPVWVRP